MHIEKWIVWSVEKIPTDWNNAKVVPIFKSGAVNDKNNYSPISILPVLSKALERLLHMHFLTFLEENNLITFVQSGFRHMHSTLTSLINITDRWLRNIDQRLVTGIIFIDLRKAFDTVNFEILGDITDDQGMFLSYSEINQKFNLECNFLEVFTDKAKHSI